MVEEQYSVWASPPPIKRDTISCDLTVLSCPGQDFSSGPDYNISGRKRGPVWQLEFIAVSGLNILLCVSHYSFILSTVNPFLSLSFFGKRNSGQEAHTMQYGLSCIYLYKGRISKTLIFVYITISDNI